jgi:peroxin-5
MIISILIIFCLMIFLQLSQGADKWVNEFSSEHNLGGLNEKWVDEFSKLHVDDEWAEEFSGGAFGESSADPWADE